jgi:hypothetical protein
MLATEQPPAKSRWVRAYGLKVRIRVG